MWSQYQIQVDGKLKRLALGVGASTSFTQFSLFPFKDDIAESAAVQNLWHLTSLKSEQEDVPVQSAGWFTGL